MAEDKKKERQIDAPVIMEYPDVDKVICKDCMFRAKGKDGATLGRCDCFPRNDKPLGILFYEELCPYYVDEKIR